MAKLRFRGARFGDTSFGLQSLHKTTKRPAVARVALEIISVDALGLGRPSDAHEFRAEPGGTRIRVTVEVWGPLAFLWDRVVARKIAQEAGAQTEAFVRFAERLS